MRMAPWLIATGIAALLAIGGVLWSPLAPQSTYADQPAVEAKKEEKAARHFESRIAPLLARHCLECHDSAAKKGGLDLSRKTAAVKGGDSGAAFVPGKADESLLWQYVEVDEMPPERPPLSADEKKLLREWIDGGAVWSLERIEPSAPVADRGLESVWLQRLTVPEYIETVRSTLGVNIEHDARRILPPDVRADGFSNTAYSLSIDLGHVEAYAELAKLIVERLDVLEFAEKQAGGKALAQARSKWPSRGNGQSDPLAEWDGEESLRKVIAGIGKWLLRGPLQEHEIDAFTGIARAVAREDGNFVEALGFTIEAMLQSPRFLYRIERQRGDGGADPVGPYELASRLSYILWGGPPDRELMQAADAGELSERSQVESQVRRMLRDRRAVERSARFAHEWLNLGRLQNLRPNSDRFPQWSNELAADMREETLAFFKHVAWEQKRPLAELMNAPVTFATPRLAEHYGLQSDGSSGRQPVSGPERIVDGLQVLYTFSEGSGATVRDTSGAGEPLDLKIDKPSAVEWSDDGLTIKSSTLIATAGAAQRLIVALKKSNAATLEAWITTDDLQQSGPARILTLSSGISQRNFTLGQDGDRFDVRFRTSKRDGNGLPSVASPQGTVKKRPMHVVYTRDATGRAKLYIDGEQQAAGNVDGDMSNWDAGFQLAVANETSGDRHWKGTLHRVAIYDRALSAKEIRSKSEGFSRYDLASVPERGGLLSQGSVLTIGGDEGSMVARGLFVLEDLLYSHVGSPPPCVDTTPVPTSPGRTQRAIAMQRIADKSCGGCHSKFEPLAFGLEKFDGIGAHHEKDRHGNKLRDDGEILFPGGDEPVAYTSSAELMDLLAGSDRVRMGITRKVAQFALGRPLIPADEPILAEIHKTAQESGGTYESLITAIVMSDLVQKTRTEADRSAAVP